MHYFSADQSPQWLVTPHVYIVHKTLCIHTRSPHLDFNMVLYKTDCKNKLDYKRKEVSKFCKRTNSLHHKNFTYLREKVLICARSDIQLWDLVEKVMSCQDIGHSALCEELNDICTVSVEELQCVRVHWFHRLTDIYEPYLVIMPQHVVLTQICVD